jgi:hypothetical protein
MKLRGKAAVLGLALCFVLTAVGFAADKGFLWTGNDWKELTPELKVAYVKGIGNMADFEMGASVTGRAACIAKAFVDELQTKPISQIVKEVDQYYKENPGKMSNSVIEVILRRCTKLCPPETTAGMK